LAIVGQSWVSPSIVMLRRRRGICNHDHIDFEKMIEQVLIVMLMTWKDLMVGECCFGVYDGKIATQGMDGD
jgi:hypothetical protein